MTKKKQVIFKCDPEDYKELKILCIRRNITVNDFFNKHLKEAIKTEK